MSAMMNPVGPEEPSVYWRRRGIVGVVLLVLLWLVWMLFSAVFGSDDAQAQQPVPAPVTSSPSPSPSESTAQSDEDQAAAKEAAAKKAAAEAAAAKEAAAKKAAAEAAAAKKAAEPSQCADGDLRVVTTPQAPSAQVGKGMVVTLSVTNTGAKACYRNLTAAVNEVRVVSGRVLVWSSDYCGRSDDGTPAKTATTTLKPGATSSAKVTWPGKVTVASCPAQQPTAQPGAYRVIGHSGDVWSAEAAFVVR